MKYMNYVENFFKEFENPHSHEVQLSQTQTSKRVIELAHQIQVWHDNRPIPERWYPVQLGRLAAQFNVSRDVMATGLAFAGWTEQRNGSISEWQPR